MVAASAEPGAPKPAKNCSENDRFWPRPPPITGAPSALTPPRAAPAALKEPREARALAASRKRRTRHFAAADQSGFSSGYLTSPSGYRWLCAHLPLPCPRPGHAPRHLQPLRRRKPGGACRGRRGEVRGRGGATVRVPRAPLLERPELVHEARLQGRQVPYEPRVVLPGVGHCGACANPEGEHAAALHGVRVVGRRVRLDLDPRHFLEALVRRRARLIEGERGGFVRPVVRVSQEHRLIELEPKA